MCKINFSGLSVLFVSMIFLLTLSSCSSMSPVIPVKNSHEFTVMADTTFKGVDDSAVVVVVVKELARGLGSNHGSGFVINKEDGFIVTAHHIIDKVVADPDLYFIDVRVEKKWHTASIVWEDSIADIAVLKLDEKVELIHQLNIVSTEVVVWDRCVCVGYQYGFLDKHRVYLNREILVEITKVDSSMITISPGIGIKRWEVFVEKKAEGLVGEYSDLFYTKYIVANTAEPIVSYVAGMSGGPLLNFDGVAIGVVAMYGEGEIVFIPAREIPQKYRGKK